MNVLFLKLGATGDVVRTTPLLRRFAGHVTWVTAGKNLPLVRDLSRPVRAVSWEERSEIADRHYDLVVNLEDDLETSLFLRKLDYERVYGAHAADDDTLHYSDDSQAWFDLSLISKFGRAEADKKKLKNRLTYQELIFAGLGFEFDDDEYLLPSSPSAALRGDIAISPRAGAVWPMKGWAYYDQLTTELRARGLVVNELPTRASLLEHLADVRGHRCLVSGDSLPMHLALGSGVRCVSLFNCTSPWEIHGYNLQTKLVSPLLKEFFYKRGFDTRATTAISLEQVIEAVTLQLQEGTQGELS